MKKYLIKVVHEELIDSFDLDNIRGGNIIDTCNLKMVNLMCVAHIATGND